MTQIIEVTNKFFIETYVDEKGRPSAKLIQNTPKAARRKTKVVKNYYFRSEERRADWIKEVKDQYKKDQDQKDQRKAETKQATSNAKVQVGDIFCHSWGWEQTNINFFQVVEHKGQSIVLREICKTKKYTGDMQGTCMPIKDKFIDSEKPFTKRIKALKDGKVYVSTEYGWCDLWNGTEEHWSSYA